VSLTGKPGILSCSAGILPALLLCLFRYKRRVQLAIFPSDGFCSAGILPALLPCLFWIQAASSALGVPLLWHSLQAVLRRSPAKAGWRLCHCQSDCTIFRFCLCSGRTEPVPTLVGSPVHFRTLRRAASPSAATRHRFPSQWSIFLHVIPNGERDLLFAQPLVAVF
jgi:hypothetical protein